MSVNKCDPIFTAFPFLAGQESQDNCSCVNDIKGPIIGGPFTLQDTENRTVTEKNLQGNWAVLYFGYTSSPDVGPEQVQLMAKAINILGLVLRLAFHN